jgi:hypothetical protein
MQGVPCLIEIEGGKGQQIQPCFDQFEMADHHLHAGLQLPVVPILSSAGWNRRAQDRDPDPLLPQYALVSQRYVPLSCTGGIDLATSPLLQFFFDVGDQSTLLRLERLPPEETEGGFSSNQ